MRQLIVRAAFAALAFALSACGGGSGGSAVVPSGSSGTPASAAPPTPTSASTATPTPVVFATPTPVSSTAPTTAPPAAPGTVAIVIAVPGRAGVAIARRVRPATPAQNVQAIVVIQPQSGAAIAPAPVACAATCSLTVQVPAGLARIGVTLEDATTKAPLGQGQAAVVIASGQTSTLPLALDGIVNSVGVALSSSSLPAGSAGATLAVVNAYDAQGNLITYGGNYMDASGNAVVIGLTSSDPTISLSTTSISAPNSIVTLSYSGAASQGIATIAPSIVAGSVGGALTSAKISVLPTITAAPHTWPFQVETATADSAYLISNAGGNISYYTLASSTYLPTWVLWTPATLPWRTPLTSDGAYNVTGVQSGSGVFVNQNNVSGNACGTGTPAFIDTKSGITFCETAAPSNGTVSIGGGSVSTFAFAGDIVEFGGVPYVNQRGSLTPYNGAPVTSGALSTGTMSTCGDGNYYMAEINGYSLEFAALQVGASGPTGAVTALGTMPPQTATQPYPPPSSDLVTAKVGNTCSLVAFYNGAIVRTTANGLVVSQPISATPTLLFTSGANVYAATGAPNYDQYQINL